MTLSFPRIVLSTWSSAEISFLTSKTVKIVAHIACFEVVETNFFPERPDAVRSAPVQKQGRPSDVPTVDQFVDGMTISPPSVQASATVQDYGFGVIEVGQA
jgi:hypothetical protein